jgi:HEAT repeat protein
MKRLPSLLPLFLLMGTARAADPLNLMDAEHYSASTLLQAMEQIQSYRPPQAVEPLTKLLGHPDPQVARTAAWLLRRMGQSAAGRQAAAGVLSSAQAPEQSRICAALALGELRDAGGVDPLAAALTADSSEAVRAQAALSLGTLALYGLASRLGAASSDPSPRVRAAAVRALGQLPDSGSEAILAFFSDEDFSVRRQAAWSLGQKRFTGQPAVAGRLSQMLQQDANCDCRAAAAWALGVLADPSTRTTLEATSEQPCRRAYQAARWALSQMK